MKPVTEANLDTLGFDLRGPCEECPFRLGAKFHAGVAKGLLDWHGLVETGQFVFTCHKTDPRSDSPVGKKFRGKLQHCGGVLAMMKADSEMLGRAQARAMDRGVWKPERMLPRPRVFKTLLAMLKHYASNFPKELA